MRQVEIQAYSVDEAVRLALEQLGRTRDQVKVEVLATDPGSEEVLVRVTAREILKGVTADDEASPKAPRPPASAPSSGPPPQQQPRSEYRDRDRGRPGGNRDRGPRGGGYGDRPSGWDRSGNRAAQAPRPAPVSEEEYVEEEDLGNRIETDVDLDSSVQSRELAPGEHATPEDAVAPIAAEVLQKVLVRMRVRGRIVRRDASEEGEAAFPDDHQSLTLNVTGLSERDQSTLIGRRGETLDALQFLVNLVVGRQVDLWTRVIIDVEGYRLRRKFALINLARRTAEQVESRRQAIPLEAMPAFERRIIHMALAEHPNVTTESSGVEPERRVVVLPR